MSVTTHDHAHDDHQHAHHPGFVRRWLFSTNHKDIGSLYLMFAICAGIVGGTLSIIMRAQLQSPGNHIIETGQQWNALVTAHGLIMIFFTVMPAMIGGVRQLVRAVDDRCAGHGVPPPEQCQLLAAGPRLRPDHEWAC